jgi:glycosyltransferase involved in cell wall biosynthesis
MKPVVTIGMCAKDSQDSIAFALQSVANQTYPHELMEIVFVDDGSSDKTPEIMQDFASRADIESRIFSGPWKGLGKARNTIINDARGDYIAWVDADELLERDFLKKQIPLFEKDRKVGIVSARVGILPSENQILALDLIPSVVEYSMQDWKGRGKFPGTGGAIFRTEAARQVGGFDESIKGIGEDIELANRIRQTGWEIRRGDAVFYEKHGKLGTWRNLWNRYVNQGIHGRRLYQKTDFFASVYRMNPFASFAVSFRYAVFGYMITRRKDAFLLPIHFTYKMLAWFYGFGKD